MNGIANGPAPEGHAGQRLSMEQAVHRDAFLDQLISDRRPAAHDLNGQELPDRLLDAQLRLQAADKQTPTRAFVR
jgi:hypothetical protein